MAEPVRFVRIRVCKKCGEYLDETEWEQKSGLCTRCLTFKGTRYKWYESLTEEQRNRYLFVEFTDEDDV